MVNNNVRQLVDNALATGQLNSADDIYVMAQKVTDLLVDSCVNLCMEDYKNQGNYGAGYRLAKEIEEKFKV